MSNLNEYASIIKRYAHSRADAKSDFVEEMQSIQQMEGSEYYEKKKKEFETIYLLEMRNLKKELVKDITPVLQNMKNALLTKKMDIPSDEQMRLLQALKMRDHLTQKEIEQACNTLAESETGISLLSEIAKKHGLILPAEIRNTVISEESIINNLYNNAIELADTQDSIRNQTGTVNANYIRYKPILDESADVNEIISRLGNLPYSSEPGAYYDNAKPNEKVISDIEKALG